MLLLLSSSLSLSLLSIDVMRHLFLHVLYVCAPQMTVYDYDYDHDRC